MFITCRPPRSIQGMLVLPAWAQTSKTLTLHSLAPTDHPAYDSYPSRCPGAHARQRPACLHFGRASESSGHLLSTPGMHLPPISSWRSSHSGLSLKWPIQLLNSLSYPVIRYPHSLTTIWNFPDLLAHSIRLIHWLPPLSRTQAPAEPLCPPAPWPHPRHAERYLARSRCSVNTLRESRQLYVNPRNIR